MHPPIGLLPDIIMNPYIIILTLFLIAGLATTAWGWTIIARGKRTQRWPAVDGTITQNKSSDSDALPEIEFSYTVGGKEYRRNHDYPSGTTPSQQLSANYASKYPVGSFVKVHYDPAHPEHATFEPGLARGDWMIFLLGGIATFFAAVFLLFGGV